MATSATAIAAATSSSLSFHNKLPHLPSESSSSSYSFISIPNTHFTPQSKPTNPIKLKASSSTLLLRLRLPISSSAFDNVDVVTEDEQSTEQSESETETDPEDEIEGGDDQSETESPGAGRLYVGNLPYAMTSTQLREVFGEAGSVLSVEIVYDRVTDRSRGFAFVTMASVEDAKVAIQMFDGSQVGGRTVKVNFPEVPKGGEREVMGQRIRSTNQGFVESPHKLYAGNLSWNLTSQGLRDIFAEYPGLLSTKVIYDRDSGRSRGFGFITFSSAQEAETALNNLNGVEVEGRPLRLNMAEDRASTTSSSSSQE